MRRWLVIGVVLFCTSASFAADQPVLIEETGEARLGEMDTPKEVMARARRDAQSKAIEKAVGAFIKAHTLVSNNQIAEDLVYAAVRGKIEKTEILQEGWDAKDRNLYRVSLKALVEPVYPEKGQCLSLKVSLSKSVLKERDETKVLYQANSDAYVYIFSIAADGSVTLLLPNSVDKDNRVLRDKAYEFPPANSPVRLQAMFLPGYKEKAAEERIKIIATKNEEALVPLGFQEGMVKVYDAKSTGLVSELVKRLSQLDPAEWTEASAAYRIVR
jgi:Ni,Fe-hydrogenase III component G